MHGVLTLVPPFFLIPSIGCTILSYRNNIKSKYDLEKKNGGITLKKSDQECLIAVNFKIRICYVMWYGPGG